jgi:hypothetical protein
MDDVFSYVKTSWESRTGASAKAPTRKTITVQTIVRPSAGAAARAPR